MLVDTYMCQFGHFEYQLILTINMYMCVKNIKNINGYIFKIHI